MNFDKYYIFINSSKCDDFNIFKVQTVSACIKNVYDLNVLFFFKCVNFFVNANGAYIYSIT